MTEEQKHKIAYLISRYPAVSHTFILREIMHLKKKGWEVKVASINPPDQPFEKLTGEEREEYCKTFYVKQTSLLKIAKDFLLTLVQNPLGFFKGFFYAINLAGLDAKKNLYHFFYFIEAILVGTWMRRNRISHLHVHFANPASSAGLIMTKIFPHSFSITIHGPDEFYDASGYKLKQKIEGANFLCCIGKYARSQLMNLSPISQWPKFEITPMGVDPNVFIPKAFRKDPSCYELLCVGRLVPSKGQHILLRAIDILIKEGRNIRLHIIGAGPDQGSLQDEASKLNIQSSVVFHGPVSQDEIRKHYQNADIFILASFAEGIPVVLMEAMAMEIPCISTHINGIPELIRNGIDGILVIPSDVQELAGAIGCLIDNTSLREKLGKAGRQRIIEKYDLHDNMEQVRRIFLRRLYGSNNREEESAQKHSASEKAYR